MIDFSTATNNQLMIVYLLFKPSYTEVSDEDSKAAFVMPYRSDILGIFNAVENELIVRGVL